MKEEHLSVREWQQQYKAGVFANRDRAVQVKAGWYDWFCKDEHLAGRLKKLAPAVMSITEPYILDNYYVWFKNNCPLRGPLYDDVRFEPLAGKRDGKYFLISRNDPRESQKWVLYTERYGYDAPEYRCGNVHKMTKYVNQLGRELRDGVIPEFITERNHGKLYIAYGSNLNLAQMKQRCPTANVVSKATLEGYKMTFRGGVLSGVATLEPEEHSSVPVLVWKIYPADEASLDRYEGAPRLYRKEMWPVEVEGETVEALIYIMNSGHPIRRPSSSYYQTILEGYQSAGFDPQILYDYAYAGNSAEEADYKDATSNDEEVAEDSSLSAPDNTAPVLTDTIREQILEVRDSGFTNMFDTSTVQQLAHQWSFPELVTFIEEHRDKYIRFILTGEES